MLSLKKIIALGIIFTIVISMSLCLNSSFKYSKLDTNYKATISINSFPDIWYYGTEGVSHNPLLLNGSMNSFYKDSILYKPNYIEINFSVSDLNASNIDLSYILINNFINNTVNFTYTPEVSGNFGDSENYIENSTYYYIFYPNMTCFNYYWLWFENKSTSSGFLLSRFKFGFIPRESHLFTWSILFALDTVGSESKNYDGHELVFTVTIKYVWSKLFLGVFNTGEFSITREVSYGNGEPFHLFLLNGIVGYSFL